MATQSRYPSPQGAGNTLNPNTQTSTSSGTSTDVQKSSQSQYQGLTSQGLADTQQLINRLMYGSNPVSETIYTDSKGKEHSLASYIARYGQETGPAMWNWFQQMVRSTSPGVFENPYDSSAGKLTQSVRITPSADGVLNGSPDKRQALATINDLLKSFGPEAMQGNVQEAMRYSIQRAMESNLSNIARATDAAGTSGSSMSALLSNDLAARASGEAALLSLQAQRDAGNTSAALGNTLANLASSKDAGIEQLLSALELTQINSGSSTSTGTSTRTEQSNTAPLGQTNPELFQSTPSISDPAPASSSTYRKYYSDSPSYSTPSTTNASTGLNYIVNNSTGALTTFGNTTPEQAALNYRTL